MNNNSVLSSLLRSPFGLYALGFIFSLGVYLLRWSDWFLEINYKVVVFLVITIIISLFLCFNCKSYNAIFYFVPKDKSNFKFLKWIVIGNVLQYIYCKNIPLISVVFLSQGNYRDFSGIPVFGVILASFSIVVSLHFFHQYLCHKDTKLLVYFFAILSFQLLNINRGYLLMMLSSIFVMYLAKIKVIRLKLLFRTLLASIMILFLFGVLGNIRNVVSQDDSSYILKVGGASQSFIDSNIPHELYWPYLYIASALGNLNNLVKNMEPVHTEDNLTLFVKTNFFPDFISKRLITEKEMESHDFSSYFVTELLNAPTVYYNPYFLFGCIGMYLKFFSMIFFVFLFKNLIKRNSPYCLSGMVYMGALMLFCPFNNMWYGGLTTLILMVFMSKYKNYRIVYGKGC